MSSKGQVKNNAEYYALGHYGKVVQYGATRLTTSGEAVKGVAFQNPDGSMVYMGVFHGKEPKEVIFHSEKKSFSYQFKPGEVVSFKWSE